MKREITEIPIEELLADKAESENDITVCVLALGLGIESYAGGQESVERRLLVNRKIIEKIDAELERSGSGISLSLVWDGEGI